MCWNSMRLFELLSDAKESFSLGIIKFQRMSLTYGIIFLLKRIDSSRLKSRWNGQWFFHWDLKSNALLISNRSKNNSSIFAYTFKRKTRYKNALADTQNTRHRPSSSSMWPNSTSWRTWKYKNVKITSLTLILIC